MNIRVLVGMNTKRSLSTPATTQQILTSHPSSTLLRWKESDSPCLFEENIFAMRIRFTVFWHSMVLYKVFDEPCGSPWKWHCGKMTDVSDLIDDLVQDTSDRFIVDDKGNFKSKFTKRSEDRARFEERNRMIWSQLCTIEIQIYTDSSKRANQVRSRAIRRNLHEHDESMRATGPRTVTVS
jgi:hypothetical protein